MGVRREGREAAAQYLYLREVNGECDLESFYKFRGLSPSARKFCGSLVAGTGAQQASIDETIAKFAQNYELNRIAAVDRNILRVAIYEMLFRKDIPPIVSINEAIDLSKQFSNADAKRFINGILDRLKDQLGRDARKATEQ